MFEYITLVCGRRLLDRAKMSIPKWWGLQKAESKDGTVVLRSIRAARQILIRTRLHWRECSGKLKRLYVYANMDSERCYLQAICR